jgi:hypothetical protein
MSDTNTQSTNSEKFYRQQDEEMRALCDRNLSPGAARLFCLLVKLGWKPELGGRYLGRVGSIRCENANWLARLCGGASVNAFYRKTRKEKRDAIGKLLRAASETLGWLEELVNGGYIWIGKHRVKNIPKHKWPNVYNVACHVPRQVTADLAWADGNFGTEVVIAEDEAVNTTVWDGEIRAENAAGDGEHQQNGGGNHRSGGLPNTKAGDGQSPRAVMGNHRNGGLPVTGTEDGQSPRAVMGNHRSGGLPVPKAEDRPSVNPVNLKKTGDRRKPPEIKRGDTPAPDLELEKFKKSLEGEFPRELKALKAELKAELSKADDAERHLFFKARLAAVDAKLLGGTPPPNTKSAPKAAPAKAMPPSKLTDDELIAHVEYCIGAKKLALVTAEQRQRVRQLGVTWKGVKL